MSKCEEVFVPKYQIFALHNDGKVIRYPKSQLEGKHPKDAFRASDIWDWVDAKSFPHACKLLGVPCKGIGTKQEPSIIPW